MCHWKHNVKIKNLLINCSRFEFNPIELSDSMRAIGAKLEKYKCFDDFMAIGDFDDYWDNLEDADCLLAEMYDYADSNDIWIK